MKHLILIVVGSAVLVNVMFIYVRPRGIHMGNSIGVYKIIPSPILRVSTQ